MNSERLGLGVMIGILSGSPSKTDQAVSQCLGKVITDISLNDESFVLISFKDNTLKLWDDGQSCCERRWMHTDDDLKRLIGQQLRTIELQEGPYYDLNYGLKESQFLYIRTDKDDVTLVNYNEHNGYYGGFLLAARLVQFPTNNSKPEPTL